MDELLDNQLVVTQSEDIEMMDTDVEPICTFKRRLSSATSGSGHHKSTTLPTHPTHYEQHSRHVLKAKRRVVSPKKSPNDSDQQMVCVLDTNILLSNLNQLKQLVVRQELARQMCDQKDIKIKSLVIPWVVVQELDHMKTNNRHNSVVNVIHYINEQLNKTNGLMKGENPCKRHVKTIDEEINDDKVLNCCLHMKSLDQNVVLITNDINLCNKALMNDLIAVNWQQFCRKYSLNDLNESDNQSDANSSSNSLTCDMNDDSVSQPKQKRSKSDHFSDDKRKQLSSGSITRPKSMSRSPLKHSKSVKISPKREKKSLSFNSITSESSDVKADDCPLKYDDWIRFRDQCEQQLLKFVEIVYKQIWDNDWRRMLEIDINNTSLKHIVRLIRKEWFSNFSDRFNRNQQIKQLIDSLHTSLAKSDTNYHLFYADLKKFCNLCQQNLDDFQSKN